MTEKGKKQEEENNVLKQIREALDLTQDEMASLLSVTSSTVSKCERGITEMRLTFEQWQRLASVLRHRLNYDVVKDSPLKLSDRKKLQIIAK
jgi:DNA-binding XRE family transcriptional regulator